MIDTLKKLAEAMAGGHSVRLYAKKLAPNDNSRNQIYLGSNFGVLNIIPHEAVYTDKTDQAGSVRNRSKAPVKFFWVDEASKYQAPNAQLILYQNYPEVRMSGFLQGCERAPSDIMNSRAEGRIMFLGILPDKNVLGFAVFKDHPIALELSAEMNAEQIGVFLDLSSVVAGGGDSKNSLLQTLRFIHEKGWISSQILGQDGIPYPYAAQNGGGMTLEAELGISPNGYAQPDYLGWEVKQYGVNNFQDYRARSPITLMTPEPTSGEYKDNGIIDFMKRYGYADRNGVEDRINFGGIYRNEGDFHRRTGLALRIKGFDASSKQITDMDGGIYLTTIDDNVAAMWDFSGLDAHWNRKHARAVYVPSMSRKPPPEYRYGGEVTLCEQTDFLLFLCAISSGMLYYDPAIKMENASSNNPNIKRRSQFRIRQADTNFLYASSVMHALS